MTSNERLNVVLNKNRRLAEGAWLCHMHVISTYWRQRLVYVLLLIPRTNFLWIHFIMMFNKPIFPTRKKKMYKTIKKISYHSIRAEVNYHSKSIYNSNPIFTIRSLKNNKKFKTNQSTESTFFFFYRKRHFMQITTIFVFFCSRTIDGRLRERARQREECSE